MGLTNHKIKNQFVCMDMSPIAKHTIEKRIHFEGKKHIQFNILFGVTFLQEIILPIIYV